VRFGDLMFVLEGDAVPQPVSYAPSSAGSSMGDYQPPRQTPWALYGGVGAIVLLGAVGGTALVMRGGQLMIRLRICPR
jgi:hypothetical protein